MSVNPAVEVTHTQTNSSNPVSAAQNHGCVSDFTSIVGQMHHYERENSRISSGYYLDCHSGHSPITGRNVDTKSPEPHIKLCSSTCVSSIGSTVSHPGQHNLIYIDPSSVDPKSACRNPIVFTPSEQLSPPPSPLYQPFASPVSPPSSSPPLFTPPLICSPGSLPQILHLHKVEALPTSLSLSLDSGEVFAPSQTTWRPWSWNGTECWCPNLWPRTKKRCL